MHEAKEWLKRVRYEIGEVAAFESICDVGLTVCSPEEHSAAARLANRIPGLETEDALGLMVLIGWEIDDA